MTSRLGSKDNIKHIPGGGNVSNVTACGVVLVQTNKQTNTIILSIVPHDALRPNNETLSSLMNKKRAADAPGGTLPNPFPKSVGAELHFPKQTKSWWQQRFGFIIFSHSNSPCRAQICCVAFSEISLFRDHLSCQCFIFPVTWCLTSDSSTACHLIFDLSSFHWSCRMIVFVHRSRFSARRLTWVKWLRSVDPKATSNTNQVFYNQDFTFLALVSV